MSEKENRELFCSVRILDVPYSADVPYDYYIPPHFEESAVVGSFVSVPFGRGNRNVAAIITSLKTTPSFEEPKPIADVSAGGELVDAEAMELCRFLCDYTLCTYGEAVKTVVPAAALSRLDKYYSVTEKEKGIEKLSEKALIFYTYIKSRTTV